MTKTIEQIASNCFHQPFVGEFTSCLKRVVNAPTGSVSDTMIYDMYQYIEKLEKTLIQLAQATEELDAIYRSELDEPPQRPKWLTDAIDAAYNIVN